MNEWESCEGGEIGYAFNVLLLFSKGKGCGVGERFGELRHVSDG